MSCSPYSLKGQKALITGASSAIGEAIARSYAASGAAVAINYDSEVQKAEKIVDDIKAANGEAFAIQANVANEDDVKSMFSQVFKEFGTIDILVSNAGIQKDSSFVDMTLEEWNTVIGVNLTGHFLCAREAAKEFLRRGVKPEISCAAGKIICMSSMHEVMPWGSHANYAASKGGISMMMQSIATELAPHKIRVNAIAPSPNKTSIKKLASDTSEAEAKLLQLISSKRVENVEDIASSAVWLASDESNYVNGTTLFVDGGMILCPGFTEN